MTAAPEPLLPCPCCGPLNKHELQKAFHPRLERDGIICWVECPCGMQSGKFGGDERAITAWNRRQALPDCAEIAERAALEREVERLTKQKNRLAKLVVPLTNEANVLTARLAALQKAAAPFVELGEKLLNNYVLGEYIKVHLQRITWDGEHDILPADFRALAAASKGE